MNVNILISLVIIIFFIICIRAGKMTINNSTNIPNINLRDKNIDSIDIPDVKWPYINLKDENGKNINMLCIRGYLITEKEKKQFLDYINKGIKFVGCSSNLSFPRKCDSIHGSCHIEKNILINGKKVEEYVLGWLHCFKRPEEYVYGNIPRLLISESDFTPDYIKPNNKNKTKIYDYITIQPRDSISCDTGWWHHYKNWPLAHKCIKVFTDELGLKGLIVGRDDCPVSVDNINLVTITGQINYFKLLDYMRQTKFILLPNLEEASPRVLTEALSVNIPIFLYDNILCGWKYLNDKTGIGFNEDNIKIQAEELLKNISVGKYSPEKYYRENYGLKISGKQLRNFLKEINPGVSDCEYVKFPVS